MSALRQFNNLIDTDLPVAPTITGTVGGQTTTRVATIDPFLGVTIADPNVDATTETLTIALSDGGATGLLSGTDLTGGTGGVYTLTAAAITTELDVLSFAPTPGAPGSVTTTTFARSDLSSGFATPTTDDTTTLTDTDLLANIVLFQCANADGVISLSETNGTPSGIFELDPITGADASGLSPSNHPAT
jgi:hypothetical protein